MFSFSGSKARKRLIGEDSWAGQRMEGQTGALGEKNSAGIERSHLIEDGQINWEGKKRSKNRRSLPLYGEGGKSNKERTMADKLELKKQRKLRKGEIYLIKRNGGSGSSICPRILAFKSRVES